MSSLKFPKDTCLCSQIVQVLRRRKDLCLRTAIGVIDLDYFGPEDEIRTLVYNFRDEPVTVSRGEKVSQGIFVRVDIADWEEVEGVIKNESRGGFGSTG